MLFLIIELIFTFCVHFVVNVCKAIHDDRNIATHINNGRIYLNNPINKIAHAHVCFNKVSFWFIFVCTSSIHVDTQEKSEFSCGKYYKIAQAALVAFCSFKCSVINNSLPSFSITVCFSCLILFPIKAHYAKWTNCVVLFLKSSFLCLNIFFLHLFNDANLWCW